MALADIQLYRKFAVRRLLEHPAVSQLFLVHHQAFLGQVRRLLEEELARIKRAPQSAWWGTAAEQVQTRCNP